TFYTSNVEQYLFDQADDWQRFYTNLATLPLDSSSTLIRSSHFAPAGARLRRVPSNYVMLRSSIADLVKAFKEGRIQNYYNAIQMSHEYISGDLSTASPACLSQLLHGHEVPSF